MYYLGLLIPLILSTALLAANHLAQPPADLKPRIFVIGLSKTGTTSLGNALSLLRYRRIGWKDIRSRQLVHTFVNGDMQPLIEQTKYFDAFEDLPWPSMYKQMAEMYPDSKFILSLRKDEQTWLRSMQRHHSRGVWEPAAFFYGTHDMDDNPEVVLDVYRSHTANVRNFFHDMPDRYGEIVIDDDSEKNWKALCRLAQCPEGRVPAISFPRSNTVEHWKDGSFVANLRWLWGWSITRIEEVCVDLYYGRDWPVVRLVMEQVWHLVSVIELAICDMYYKLAVQGQPPLPVS